MLQKLNFVNFVKNIKKIKNFKTKTFYWEFPSNYKVYFNNVYGNKQIHNFMKIKLLIITNHQPCLYTIAFYE